MRPSLRPSLEGPRTARLECPCACCDPFLADCLPERTISQKAIPSVLRGPVMQVNRALGEAVFVHELELDLGRLAERPCAAAHYHRHQDEVELVDQTGVERLGGELGAAHAEI